MASTMNPSTEIIPMKSANSMEQHDYDNAAFRNANNSTNSNNSNQNNTNVGIVTNDGENQTSQNEVKNEQIEMDTKAYDNLPKKEEK